MPTRISTDVFVIPLLDRYLVYAPLRRVAFIANAATVNWLYRLRYGEVQPANEEEAAFLQFCEQICLTGEEGDWPITTLECATFQPTEVTLFLTTRCNLRCIYCYAAAGDRPLAEMDLTTAKRGIEFVCRNALERGKSEFGVGYHGGGEPTMHWSVLTESFAYAQQLARENGLEVYGSMATNGVLSPEKRQWIIRNFRGVNISWDGLPAVQDMQRPTLSGKPSSEAVMQTIRDFDAANFQYGLRVTVTAASVEYLPQSIAYLLDKAHPKHIQVEPMYILGRGRETGLEVEPLAFVQAFQQAKQIAGQAGVDFFYSAARVDVLTNRFCQSCGEGFSLTPQGLVSACYEVPDAGFEFGEQFIFGRYDEWQGRYVFDEEKLTRLRNHTVEQIPWCQGCFCKWHCAGDCTYKARHAMVDGQFVGEPRCEITRALTLDQILEKIKQNGGQVWTEQATALSLYVVVLDKVFREANRFKKDSRTVPMHSIDGFTKSFQMVKRYIGGRGNNTCIIQGVVHGCMRPPRRMKNIHQGHKDSPRFFLRVPLCPLWANVFSKEKEGVYVNHSRFLSINGYRCG